MQRIFTKRERLILYFTVGLIIFSVVFNILIVPVIKKNEFLNREIKVTRQRINKYLRLQSQKAVIQGKFSKLSATIDLSSKKDDTLMTSLSELENLAKGSGIRIIDIRPQVNSESRASLKEVTIDLKADGEIEGYLKFIYDLENSLSLLRIKRLQFSSRPSTPSLEATFTISQITHLD